MGQTATNSSSFGKLLGVVRIEVGAKTFKLPVQSVVFSRDAGEKAGGFFDDGRGELGILVSSDASPAEIEAQIKQGAEDAVSHLSRRSMN